MTARPGQAPPSENPEGRVVAVAAHRLIADWAEAYVRAVDYLSVLGVPDSEREAVARRAVEMAATSDRSHQPFDAVAETLRAVRELHGVAPVARLEILPRMRRRPFPEATMVRQFTRPALRPSMRRSGRLEREHKNGVRERRRRLVWTLAAKRRRMAFLALVCLPSIVASGFMLQVLPHHGGTLLEHVIVLLFAALFGWISIGFWTAVVGFLLLASRKDRFSIADLAKETVPIDPSARTAIVMPICEEPVERVFAGLYATYRSLERTGELDHFDFFVLSDSATPDAWIREEAAWARLCSRVNGFGRIFYRRRRVRIKRKSGNVAEFCRAWGYRYRYMVVLDADSVMAGDTVAKLVRLMERTPDAGLVQTAPTAVGRRSLFGRMQQFAVRVYGPMFAAGLHFWQLGDGQYWGHNAIIRIAPFMEHCGLGRLTGRPPFGGEILSHDFVEAALLGRAGWTLWLAYDLGGSFEEIPSSLLEEVKRDRRWCQGNLQHLRLLFTKGLFGAHRALFLNGALSYVSALLWFLLLLASTGETLLSVWRPPDYFPEGRSLVPSWPVWRPDWAYALLAVTAAILFAPKVLSVLLVLWREGRGRTYGGTGRLLLSAILETILSSLFAPIRMVFHTRFVLTNLLGRTVAWRSSRREDSETTWSEALRFHALDTVLAALWGAALFWLRPEYFWWVLPVIGALVLSVPLSVLASRISLGQRARALGLFVIPEESEPSTELRDLADDLASSIEEARTVPADGLVACAVDPFRSALHLSFLGAPRRLRADIGEARRRTLDRVVSRSPAEASQEERRVVLSDPALSRDLHERMWAAPRPVFSTWRRSESSEARVDGPA